MQQIRIINSPFLPSYDLEMGSQSGLIARGRLSAADSDPVWFCVANSSLSRFAKFIASCPETVWCLRSWRFDIRDGFFLSLMLHSSSCSSSILLTIESSSPDLKRKGNVWLLKIKFVLGNLGGLTAFFDWAFGRKPGLKWNILMREALLIVLTLTLVANFSARSN